MRLETAGYPLLYINGGREKNFVEFFSFISLFEGKKLYLNNKFPINTGVFHCNMYRLYREAERSTEWTPLTTIMIMISPMMTMRVRIMIVPTTNADNKNNHA